MLNTSILKQNLLFRLLNKCTIDTCYFLKILIFRYSLRLTIGVIFPKKNYLKSFVLLQIQHLLLFSTNLPLFIAFQLSIIIPLTIINKSILVNNTFLPSKLTLLIISFKYDTYYKTEGVYRMTLHNCKMNWTLVLNLSTLLVNFCVIMP